MFLTSTVGLVTVVVVAVVLAGVAVSSLLGMLRENSGHTQGAEPSPEGHNKSLQVRQSINRMTRAV
jgi:hypothetical protein